MIEQFPSGLIACDFFKDDSVNISPKKIFNVANYNVLLD
jgi:hypothetical protein